MNILSGLVTFLLVATIISSPYLAHVFARKVQDRSTPEQFFACSFGPVEKYDGECP